MYRGLKIRMIAGVFSKMVQVKIDIFNILLTKKQNKNCETLKSDILYPMDMSFKSKVKWF